jgi:hypothetical protein
MDTDEKDWQGASHRARRYCLLESGAHGVTRPAKISVLIRVHPWLIYFCGANTTGTSRSARALRTQSPVSKNAM